MEESKELAQKMVELTVAQADICVFKHLNDYMKKYAQKLQRELNDVNHRLEKMEKKGQNGNDYGLLHAKSNLLTFQIHKAKNLELEFLKRSMDLCDSCENPLNEAQDIYNRLIRS